MKPSHLQPSQPSLSSLLGSDLDGHRLSDEAHEQIRARIVAHATKGGTPPLRAWPKARFGAKSFRVLAAAAGVLALIGGVRIFKDRPLRYEVKGIGHEEGFIAASKDESAPVLFSDGTELTLAPLGRARIGSVDSRGAEINLEAGEIHAKVTHREKTRWNVNAGPFTVHVTGTEFITKWDPSTQAVRVTLIEGSVQVSGCGVESKRVAKGEELTAACSATGATPVLSTSHPRDDEKPREDRTPSSRGLNLVEPSASNVKPRDLAKPRVGSIDDDPAFVESGDLDPPPPSTEDVTDKKPPHLLDPKPASVERTHTPTTSATSVQGAGALFRAAKEARVAQSFDAAKSLFLEVRKRFPKSGEATLAAFELGRSSFDRDHDYVAATNWFSTYLAEAPNGVLARDALGRIIESRTLSGDAAGAKKAGAEYLLSYPSGPHESVARRVTGGKP